MNRYFINSISILAGLLFVFLIAQTIHSHDTNLCYDNIEKIFVGENYQKGLSQMESNMIWFKFEKKLCSNHEHNSSDVIVEVTFLYCDKNDPMSSYPSFCYSKSSGQIINIETGIFY
jgi:hypothetical protein